MKRIGIRILLLLLIIISIFQIFSYAYVEVDYEDYSSSFSLNLIALLLILIGILIIIISIIGKMFWGKPTSIIKADCALAMEFIAVSIFGLIKSFVLNPFVHNEDLTLFCIIYIDMFALITYILYRKESDKTKIFFIIDVWLNILFIIFLIFSIVIATM